MCSLHKFYDFEFKNVLLNLWELKVIVLLLKKDQDDPCMKMDEIWCESKR